MRLWSLHPRYLDARGLVALWREALLAKAVLGGRTKGYRHHPQLVRFRAHAAPRLAINAYLQVIHEEATSRGYRFDRRKIGRLQPVARMTVPEGQLQHEWKHLLRKLAARSPEVHARWHRTARPQHHPLFRVRPGPVAPWEKNPLE